MNMFASNENDLAIRLNRDLRDRLAREKWMARKRPPSVAIPALILTVLNALGFIAGFIFLLLYWFR